MAQRSLVFIIAALSGASSELLQTWQKTSSGTSPVVRVVNLLKEMQATLNKEMDEDEGLYDKLKCCCKDNRYEKGESIEASEAKISELESTAKSLTAKSAELNTQIKDLEAQVKSDKEALAEATALREKEAAEAHGGVLDSTQDLENLKAAIEVLSKHFDSAFPQLSPGTSLLAISSQEQPWSETHEASRSTRSLLSFMRRNGFAEGDHDPSGTTSPTQQGFLQAGEAGRSSEWSREEAAVVRVALRKAASYAQAHHRDAYFPSYNSQSGEIMGVLKQLEEEMGGDLAEAQKLEQQRVAAFEELRTAKTAEIESGEKMAEKKEDELATTDNALAESKEYLAEEQASLEEAQTFVANLEKTCGEADANFDERKKVREEEIKAVAETIAILTGDEAKDLFSSTYSFLQVTALKRSSERGGRARAAAALRRAAATSRDPKLSALATTVELDAFTKVKQAIDGMISMLTKQQEDEVKKNDWCKSELHGAEMSTSKTEDKKADLEAKEASLEEDIKALEKGIAEASTQIELLQVNLQRATEDRKKENLEYQKTVADQTATVEVLKMALERLAKFYDEADLLQQFTHGHLLRGNAFLQSTQTPPVPQVEYKAAQGASGVMSLIEKIIAEAKEMTAEAKKAEAAAQAGYEAIVADTNGSVAALQNEVASKTKAKAKTTKEKLQIGSDIVDTVSELEGLSKLTASLHTECDYLLKNFEVRQKERAEEVEALQQAKQILSGAALS